MKKPDQEQNGTQEEKVGTYSLSGKELLQSKEIIPNKDFDVAQKTLPRGAIANLINGGEPVSHINNSAEPQNTEFDTPRPTLRGVPAVGLSEAEVAGIELRKKIREAEINGGVITDIKEVKKHLTDTYPSVGSLLAELEVIHQRIESQKQQTGSITAPAEPQKPKQIDDVIGGYLEDDEPIQLQTTPQLDTDDMPIQIVVESVEDRKKPEDDTLIMPAMDTNGSVVSKQDAWLVEFAKEFEQKTGPIALTQTNADKLNQLIAKLRTMDRAQREERFHNIPLVIRRQILKVLAKEAAQKKALQKAQEPKKWPQISMTVTLGYNKKPQVRIEKI